MPGPELRPGAIVILDNHSSHKMARVAGMIAVVGAGVRYLPPYTSDLAPIEQAFAKLKAPLRQAAAAPSTSSSPPFEALTLFRPGHGWGFFRQARSASI
jgi:transposase